MKNQINISLDGILLNDLPLDITEFEEQIERDTDIFGIIKKYPLNLTFVGDGYRYLLDLKRTVGFCRRVNVLIEYFPNGNFTYPTIIRGFLFISDIEHDHTKKTITVSIEDNNFGSIIKQNSKVPVDVRSVKTRNELDMVATPSFTLTVYNPNTGNNIANPKIGFDVTDAFEHLIKFLSDNEVDFQSDFLDNLPDDEHLCIANAFDLRQSTPDDAVAFSFQDIMEFMHKKYNLWFTIDTSGVTPVFRLEPRDFFRGDSVINIPYTKNLKETFVQEEFVSTIEVGDEDAIKEFGTQHTLPFVNGLAFAEEKYYLQGQCNIDASIDLKTGSFLYDNNVIQDIVLNNTREYDGRNVIIQYVNSTGVATKSGILSSAMPPGNPQIYNEQLLNINVVNRFELHNDVALILGDGTGDEFRASTTTSTSLVTTNPVPYDDDSTPPNFDPGGNYNTTTYRYTAPGNGLYSFEAVNTFTITDLTGQGGIYSQPPFVTIRVFANRFNSSNVLVESKQINTIIRNNIGTWTTSGQGTFYMNSSDYVTIRIEVLPLNTVSFAGTIDIGSYFRTTFVFNGGGSFQDAQPNQIEIIKFDFERGVSSQEWLQLTDRLYNGVTVNTDGFNNTLCWIKSAKRKIFRGTVEWELLTNLEQMNLWE